MSRSPLFMLFTVLSVFTYFIPFNVISLGDGLLFLFCRNWDSERLDTSQGELASPRLTQVCLPVCSVHFVLHNFSQSKEALDVPNFWRNFLNEARGSTYYQPTLTVCCLFFFFSPFIKGKIALLSWLHSLDFVFPKDSILVSSKQKFIWSLLRARGRGGRFKNTLV